MGKEQEEWKAKRWHSEDITSNWYRKQDSRLPEKRVSNSTVPFPTTQDSKIAIFMVRKMPSQAPPITCIFQSLYAERLACKLSFS